MAAKKGSAKRDIKPVVFIVNASAGSGRTGKVWPEIAGRASEFTGKIEVVFTDKKGHGIVLARKYAPRARMIVAVGGDGTISEVAEGLLRSGVNIPMGILPAGSGSDLARTLHIPRDPLQALEIIAHGHAKRTDMGKVRFRDFRGRKAERYFINIADVGIGGEVISILDKQGKWGWPCLSYQVATLRGILRYKNKAFRIRIDNHDLSGTFGGVIVANGKYFGSGMMIAPQADPADGKFSVVVLPPMDMWQTIRKASAIRNGTHVRDPRVLQFFARSVVVHTDTPALLDLDGELPGGCPAEFTIMKSAIRIMLR